MDVIRAQKHDRLEIGVLAVKLSLGDDLVRFGYGRA
jgi:hypothetical protein